MYIVFMALTPWLLSQGLRRGWGLLLVVWIGALLAALLGLAVLAACGRDTSTLPDASAPSIAGVYLTNFVQTMLPSESEVSFVR